MSDAKQATPAAELERQICSATEPKNEREWWSHYEIARLRAALAAERERADRAEAEAEAVRALLRWPGDFCLSCGGDGGHEEACRGTTGLLALQAEREALRERADRAEAELATPLLSRHQPCGCVVCTCESERCGGCGARHCGAHDVGVFSSPVYEPHSLLARAEKAEAERDELRERVARLVAENGEITDLNQTQFLELEHLRRISNAAHRLYDESEEYDFDDGLGRGAPQELWDALSTEIDTMTDAQRAALEGK